MNQETPFDPYYELLSIPPAEQPPNLYRLLGINLFESNEEVITNAAYRHMTFLRRMSGGDYAEYVESLLDEVATAKLRLLHPQQRAEYDATLRSELRPVPVASLRMPPEPPAGRDAAPTDAVATRELPDQTWIVGSSDGCDMVLVGEGVSRSHCQLIRKDQQMFVEDLGSSNGTFVNNRRISRRVALASTDLVTLGRRVRFRVTGARFPQFSEVEREREGKRERERAWFVGRNTANEVVIDDGTVSEFHARLLFRDHCYILEDLGSSNGTRVAGRLIDAPCHLQPEDLVTFGDRSQQAAELIDGLDGNC